MNSREQIIQALENFRSYKFAISNGIAPYKDYDNVGMPFNSSYGSRPPMLERGGSIAASTQDFAQYDRFVKVIEWAVGEVLNDDEQMVIRRKYLDRNRTTLYQIAIDRNKDESTVRRWHRNALKSLCQSLAFVDIPEIINLDPHFKKNIKNARFMHASSW